MSQKTIYVYNAVYKLADGEYIGNVIDFPGVLASGETLNRARLNLASALLNHIDTNLLKNEPLPKPRPKQLNGKISKIVEQIEILVTFTTSVQLTNKHEENCICDVFSDLHKDVYGFRPKNLLNWNCQKIIEWENEVYEDNPEDSSIRQIKSMYSIWDGAQTHE